jgi:hypothetical protein
MYGEERRRKKERKNRRDGRGKVFFLKTFIFLPSIALHFVFDSG